MNYDYIVEDNKQDIWSVDSGRSGIEFLIEVDLRVFIQGLFQLGSTGRGYLTGSAALLVATHLGVEVVFENV